MKLPRIRDYPRRLLIDGESWAVEFLPVVEFQGEQVLGLTHFKDQRILICSKMSPRKRVEIFVHEALHALDDVYDLNISHDLIHAIEAPIVDLLIDNWPWVFEALRERRPASSQRVARPR